MQSKINKIFILGGCGFLGLETAKLLHKNNYKILIVDLPYKINICPQNIEFKGIDLLGKNIEHELKISKNDIIINLASRQYLDKVPYFNRQNWFDEMNYIVANKILDLCIKNNALGYIFFSTDMVYGNHKSLPINESSFLKPLAEYGISKSKSEQLLSKKARGKIPLTIFRPRLISGPGRLGVFKKLFKQIKKSRPIPLIGNGNNCYQMVSVYDCAQAILMAIKFNIPSEIFNLASKDNIKVKDLMKNIVLHANSKSKLIKVNGFIIKPILKVLDFLGATVLYKEQYSIADKNIILDINKAKKIIKWEPKFNDQEMINSAYDYWFKDDK